MHHVCCLGQLRTRAVLQWKRQGAGSMVGAVALVHVVRVVLTHTRTPVLVDLQDSVGALRSRVPDGTRRGNVGAGLGGPHGASPGRQDTHRHFPARHHRLLRAGVHEVLCRNFF